MCSVAPSERAGVTKAQTQVLKLCLTLYVNYVDLDDEEIVNRFFTILNIEGSPNHNALFNAIIGKVIDTCVGFTSDGAQFKACKQNGVSALLRSEWNEDLFTQHCLVLATKDALKKHIPGSVEATITKVLNYILNSPMSKVSFRQLIEPNSEYTVLIQYHKTRSRAMCVERIATLLPEIASFFEQEKQDPAVHYEKKKKASEIYDVVSDTEFQMYIYFFMENSLNCTN
ncbi:UNVERIFIED_CONTAM: hypothetical protein FKN15_000144 [Acipenser sinensis]